MIGRFALGHSDLQGARTDCKEREKWTRSQQERYLKEVAQENIEDFDMPLKEAYDDALKQLKSQFGERLHLTGADVERIVADEEAAPEGSECR